MGLQCLSLIGMVMDKKEQESQRIAEQVKKFLENGGEIEQVPTYTRSDLNSVILEEDERKWE